MTHHSLTLDFSRIVIGRTDLYVIKRRKAPSRVSWATKIVQQSFAMTHTLSDVKNKNGL